MKILIHFKLVYAQYYWNRLMMNRSSHIYSKVLNKKQSIKDKKDQQNAVSIEKKNITSKKTWEETMITLNKLQSNFATIKEALKTDKNTKIQKRDSVLHHLKLLGIDSDQLNKLNVIHVSGTKGKGSTCAYVESILRHHGYKTGLFTSPHLVSCRERIKINGKMITEQEFISNFWTIYEKIMLNCNLENRFKPGYFMFLTILAFYMFTKLNINVVILETGIGGEYDCTNVVSKPVVIGISCLGFDHVQILGSIIESIAWNKAGIIKPNSVCFTVKQQLEAFNVIKSRAEEKNSKLIVCPSIHEYKLPIYRKLKLGIEGEVQKINASLAIQLSKMWIKSLKKSSHFDLHDADDFLKLSNQELDALENTVLNGRCQTLGNNKIIYYLDGAHTIESLNNCANWFISKSFNNLNLVGKKIERILLFNILGQRDIRSLISCLNNIHFDLIIVSSNNMTFENDFTSESLEINFKNKSNSDEIINIWKKLRNGTCQENEDSIGDQMYTSVNPLNFKKFDCLKQAHEFINCYYNLNQDNFDQLHVLVTGSLHLVGNTLSLFKTCKFF